MCFDGAGNGGIEQRDRPGDRLAAANGAEFELCAGEGERRGAITVGVVLLDLGKFRHAEPDELLLSALAGLLAGDDALDERVSMSPMKTEMIAGGASFAPSRCSFPELADAGAQKSGVLVHRLEDGREEEQEAEILVRRMSRLEQIEAVEIAVCGNRH